MAEERDPEVSRRYRELGAEEPPRELDQAILAAAHRAADHSHAPLVAPAGRHRWYFAFGAAAVLVLAVAVTVQVERQQPDAEALVPAAAPSERKESFADDKAAAQSAAPQSQDEARAKVQAQPMPPKPPSGPARDAQQLRESPPSVETQSAPAAAPATPAPSQPGSQDLSSGAAAGMFSNQEQARKSRVETAPAPAPAADAARPQAAEAARADRLEAKPERPGSVDSVPKPAPQSAPQAENLRPFAMETNRGGASSSVLGAAVALSPERMLEGIAELRKQGRHDEADKALAEFRKLYPDYRISEEMLKKVERPK
jgi:hypothetical protein